MRSWMYVATALAMLLPATVVAQPSICDNLAGNLLIDCGLETGDFTGWSGSAVLDPFNSVVSGSFNGFSANSGAYFAVLGPTVEEQLAQTVNTVAGGLYTISWYLGSDGVAPNDFSVSWDGVQIFSQTGLPSTNSAYTFYSFTNPASGGSTDLTFSFQDDNGFLYLDDAAVVAASPIPEPGYAAMLAIAGVALLLRYAFIQRLARG